MGFQAKLASGEFVLFAEMDTPKGVNISDLVTNVRSLKSRIDAVILPDMDNGVVHLSALAGGAIMKQEGFEPLIHVYGRDRNRLALQGDILAAHVLGIHNVLVVSGEEMIQCDHPDAKAVDDLNEAQILSMIQTLNKGRDLAGFDLRGNPDVTAGCAIAPIADADALEKAVESARLNIEAGAQYLVLPPCFDLSFYTQMISAFKPLNVPVIASVLLLKSVGMARYIAINDPNSRLSEDVIKRIRSARDREAECISLAGEMIRSLREVSQGIKISALGWEDRLPAILDSAGL